MKWGKKTQGFSPFKNSLGFSHRLHVKYALRLISFSSVEEMQAIAQKKEEIQRKIEELERKLKKKEDGKQQQPREQVLSSFNCSFTNSYYFK